jgi:hypothetical protein
VDKPGASGRWRNSARRDLLWRGYGLGDGPFGLEEPRGRGAARTPGLSMPHTACLVRLRMLSQAKMPLSTITSEHLLRKSRSCPMAQALKRVVAGAGTKGATSTAKSDAASVVTGASTIAAAGVGTGAAVSVKEAVSMARDAGAVTGCPCSALREAVCARDSTHRALLAARVSTSMRATSAT